MATSIIKSRTFDNLAQGTDLNTVRYNYQGYVTYATNAPSGYGSGMVIAFIRENGLVVTQLFQPWNKSLLFVRNYYTSNSVGTWNDWECMMPYWGSHAVRGLGVATSTSSVAFVISWMNPRGETPTITVSGAGITGYGGITATVNTSRTNKDSIGFDLTGGTFTANASYLCYVSFTLS